MLVLMKSIPVRRTETVRRGGAERQLRKPVFLPNGQEKMLSHGTVFRTLEQVQRELGCEMVDVENLVKGGTLQWRSEEIAKRILGNRAGNNVMLEFDGSSEEAPPSKDGGVEENAVLRGTRMDYNPAHLVKQDEEQLRELLASHNSEAHVEDMDKDLLIQVLSEEYVPNS